MARTDPDAHFAMHDYPRFPPTMVAPNIGVAVKDEVLLDPSVPRRITEKQYREAMRLCVAETENLPGARYLLLTDAYWKQLERLCHVRAIYPQLRDAAMKMAAAQVGARR